MRNAVLLVALVALATWPLAGMGAPPGPATVRHVDLEAVAFACPGATVGVGDGICLGYNASSPATTLDINLGDTLVVTLKNRIAATLAAVPGDADTKARLAASNVSFHIHGMGLAPSNDGVAAHAGTRFVASVAEPGASFTYVLRAAYPGTWHFHDHVLGHDGAEGAARGLFGAVVVRAGAQARADHVLDLHFTDMGPNAGHGLSAPPIAPGERFELVGVGLGNWLWNVTLKAPGGAPVGTLDLAPGISDRLVVPEAVGGTYTWTARNTLFQTFSGTVVVS